jgi:serine/threonine protein kinase
MGVVWKAVDTKLNREVAIKILPADLAADPERRLRFQREAQSAAALNHPNIATIHEVNEQDGTDFIVMEFLEGRTLREEIGLGALPVKDWLKLVLPMAEGVAHAHNNGIIHRDLKPDNVMITGEWQVKLLDFGLAKLREPDKPLPAEMDTRLETISQEFTRRRSARSSPGTARSSGRWPTCPLSRPADRRPITVAIFSLWVSCSTRWPAASYPSRARVPSRRCIRSLPPKRSR